MKITCLPIQQRIYAYQSIKKRVYAYRSIKIYVYQLYEEYIFYQSIKIAAANWRGKYYTVLNIVNQQRPTPSGAIGTGPAHTAVRLIGPDVNV